MCHFAIRQSFNPRLGWIWYAADLSPVLNCHYREASLLAILLINCNRTGGGHKTDPPLEVDDSLKTTPRCARINEFKIVWLAAHFGSFYYNVRVCRVFCLFVAVTFYHEGEGTFVYDFKNWWWDMHENNHKKWITARKFINVSWYNIYNRMRIGNLTLDIILELFRGGLF